MSSVWLITIELVLLGRVVGSCDHHLHNHDNEEDDEAADKKEERGERWYKGRCCFNNT